MPLGAARFGLGGVSDLGKLQFIETKTISGASSAIFTDIQESTYNVHFLTVNDYQPSNDNVDLRIRFFESGVEESGSVYQFAVQTGTSAGSFPESVSSAIAYLRGTLVTGNATNEKGNLLCYFYNLGDSSKFSFQTMQTTLVDSVGTHRMGFGNGMLPQASTVDQIKLYTASGTFDATASLYGIAES